MLVTDAMELLAICVTICFVLHRQFFKKQSDYSRRIALQLFLLFTQSLLFCIKNVSMVKNGTPEEVRENFSWWVWLGYGLAQQCFMM